MGRFWNHQRESIERLTKKGVFFFQQINCWIVGLPKFLTKVTGTATTTRHFLVVHLCTYGHFVFVFLNCFQILSSVATQPVPLYFPCLSHFFQLIVDWWFWGPVIWIPIGFPEKWIRACVGPKPPNHQTPKPPTPPPGAKNHSLQTRCFTAFFCCKGRRWNCGTLDPQQTSHPPKSWALVVYAKKGERWKNPFVFPESCWANAAHETWEISLRKGPGWGGWLVGWLVDERFVGGCLWRVILSYPFFQRPVCMGF